MSNITIAVLGEPGYAKNIGKQGTESDIIFYNLKKGEDTVTLIEPTRYPERLAPLFYTVSMADAAVLVVSAITPEFGETLLMLDTANVRKGYIILKNYLDPSQITPLIAGTVLEGYQFIDDNPIELRELLLGEARMREHAEDITDVGVVSIDHHFNVKGIGTVILGGVQRGTIHKHDIMIVLPGEKKAQIRSIQKHDDNFETATRGDRVGLALKNIEADELDRGYVLTNDNSVKCTTIVGGQVHLGKFWPKPLWKDMVVHVGYWMQFIPGRIESIEENTDWKNPKITLTLDRELIYIPGESAVLHYLEGGKLRVAGRVVLS
jgi:selenocysteine-specific translation elongation factor